MIFAAQHAPLASLLALVTASVVSLQQLQPELSAARLGNTPLRAAGRFSVKQAAALLPGSGGLDVRQSPFDAK
jgi:hypothetical protein